MTIKQEELTEERIREIVREEIQLMEAEKRRRGEVFDKKLRQLGAPFR